MANKQKIIIVGGGFGGVKAALGLANREECSVTLISDSNEMRYYPTLYLTATGGTRANSSIPLDRIFAGSDVELVNKTVTTLDRKAKTITTSDNTVFGYDDLILALGVKTNYFNIPGLAEFTYSMKSQDDVAKLKNHLHDQMIKYHQPDLNYIIVGAGPSGIELAGALPDYIEHIMKKHGVRDRKIHIDIVEALPRLLPNLPKSFSRQVRQRLINQGVKIYLNSKVEGEDADNLYVSGKALKSHTVIWTAGVTNNTFFSDNRFSLMGRGKVGVDAYLMAEPNVYVIGDNANTPYSGMAQTALHDGQFIASNLLRKYQNKSLKSYKVKKPVTIIPVGHNWAAVMIGKLKFSGYLGYLLREAADWDGYHSLEPWPIATKQFLKEFQSEDNCQVCSLTE